MKTKGTRYRVDPKQGRERVKRGGFKRDAEFCALLARELDVEKAPDSYHKALRRVYAELPEDMPVRHYPLRSALKSLATVAVLVVLFGVSLLGANHVYPQLTESLPGVGMLFKTLNGTEEEPPELPQLPQPVEAPKEEEEGAHKIPKLQMVSVESTGIEDGQLYVSSAWSDGKQLYLDVALQAPAEALLLEDERLPLVICFPRDSQLEDLQESLPENAFPDVLIDSNVFINNEAVPETADIMPLYLWRAEEDATQYTGTWTLALPESVRGSESLSVDLNLTLCAGLYDGDPTDADLLPLAFRLQFTVEVDHDFTVEIEEAGPDNECQLEDIRYTPVELRASVTVPFMGYYGYSLLPEDNVYWDYHQAYGMYAVLTDEDGEILYQDTLVPFDISRNAAIPLAVTLSPRDREKLTLTLYQFDANLLETYRQTYLDADLETAYNPVVAEFTLDLAEGTAGPSENYKQAGLEKLNAGTCAAMQHHLPFTNGVYARLYDSNKHMGAQTVAKVDLCVEADKLDSIQNWALQCYSGDEVVQTVYACDVADDTSYNYVLDSENVLAYASEGGYFWRGESGQTPYEDGEYIHIYFAAAYPEWMYYDGSGLPTEFSLLQLVDMQTGEVILEDVAYSFVNNLSAVLTGALYERTYSESADYA